MKFRVASLNLTTINGTKGILMSTTKAIFLSSPSLLFLADALFIGALPSWLSKFLSFPTRLYIEVANVGHIGFVDLVVLIVLQWSIYAVGVLLITKIWNRNSLVGTNDSNRL